jgi:hypothetical protein
MFNQRLEGLQQTMAVAPRGHRRASGPGSVALVGGKALGGGAPSNAAGRLGALADPAQVSAGSTATLMASDLRRRGPDRLVTTGTRPSWPREEPSRSSRLRQRAARRLLLGQFLGGALRFGEGDVSARAIRHAHLDAKVLAVVGAALVRHHILWLPHSNRLQVLLQSRLVVAHRARKRLRRAQHIDQVCLGRLNDIAVDKVPRRRQASIQIHCGNHRFQAFASSAGFLWPPLCSSPRPRRSIGPSWMRSATCARFRLLTSDARSRVRSPSRNAESGDKRPRQPPARAPHRQ